MSDPDESQAEPGVWTTDPVRIWVELSDGSVQEQELLSEAQAEESWREWDAVEAQIAAEMRRYGHRMSRQDALAEYKAAVQAAWRREGRRPSPQSVARRLNLSESGLYKHLKNYGLPTIRRVPADWRP